MGQKAEAGEWPSRAGPGGNSSRPPRPAARSAISRRAPEREAGNEMAGPVLRKGGPHHSPGGQTGRVCIERMVVVKYERKEGKGCLGTGFF